MKRLGHVAGAILAGVSASALLANSSWAEQAGSRPGAVKAEGWRLTNAASPYLRQHADNPVAWHAWGEEAFEKARKENKPIFLSVGYSTCYWCHVMERESFVDEKIAKKLNDGFISVKVDRERRPDVDSTYMIATELISQRGGWPNSVFLTPDLKPFFAITYAPPGEFTSILDQVATTWAKEEKPLREDAERIASLIGQITQRRQEAVAITPKVMARASLGVLAGFDVFHGGIGTAPKFPREPVLDFLVNRAMREGDAVALEALEVTLDNIIRGGIHDHLGGGFHRYATDNAWAVPHFEKMLYTQALIGRLLVRAYLLTGNADYEASARTTFDFVLRDMTTSDGGFASAFDAETDGQEGLFYLWDHDELKELLGEDIAFAEKVFAAAPDGNHEGMNTLRLVAPVDELLETTRLERAQFEEKLESVFQRLRDARAKRPALKRDDKVTADWNAAMVRTLAEASVALNEPRYLEAARSAMSLLVGKLGAGTPEMQRVFFEGDARLEATQADHAEVGLAALALFDATADETWRELAKSSGTVILDRFQDEATGDFYLTASATGFVRTKQYDDSDLPAGNAAALELFARLVRRDADPKWTHAADRLLGALSGVAQRTPRAMAATLVAADLHLRGEMSPLQYLAKGAVRLSAARDASGKMVAVRAKLAPGWHINARNPDEDFLIPTILKLDGQEPQGTSYPPTQKRSLRFHDLPLDLYEGETEFTFELPDGTTSRRVVSLSLQACSDNICLEPETAHLLLPPTGVMVGEAPCPAGKAKPQ